jgi:hypothetical protein
MAQRRAALQEAGLYQQQGAASTNFMDLQAVYAMQLAALMGQAPQAMGMYSSHASPPGLHPTPHGSQPAVSTQAAHPQAQRAASAAAVPRRVPLAAVPSRPQQTGPVQPSFGCICMSGAKTCYCGHFDSNGVPRC